MNTNVIQFCKEELARYNRHIILPAFGIENQKKLKAARVLVVGAGGLGSPLLLYLAAAGVGTIGIVDYDVVEESNLHRQILFGLDEIGMPKVEAARKRMLNLNPHINIVIYNTQLKSTNALEIISAYDVVADGTDNFPTRYLVNDACVLAGIPYVYASIFQFEGQVAVFNYKDINGNPGPNYRDLYPTPPPVGQVPSCAEGGVLGVLPGIIGSLQANEVIKVITGIGETLSGRIFVFNALNFDSQIFKISANRNTAAIKELIDYEQFCGVQVLQTKIKEITVQEFATLLRSDEAIQIIDVREPEEYAQININALLIPLKSVSERASEISKHKRVIVHCKMGARSAIAIRELETKFGYKNLYHLKGGITAYMEQAEFSK